MAEGIAKKYLNNFSIESAGVKPKEIHSLAIKVMQEISIDISKYYSKSITDEEIKFFDIIITLCGDAKDQCVNINSVADIHVHWDIEDPAKFRGSQLNKLIIFRKVRDQIENKIKELKNTL